MLTILLQYHPMIDNHMPVRSLLESLKQYFDLFPTYLPTFFHTNITFLMNKLIILPLNKFQKKYLLFHHHSYKYFWHDLPSFEAVVILSVMSSPYLTRVLGLFLMSILCSFYVVYCCALWYNILRS